MQLGVVLTTGAAVSRARGMGRTQGAMGLVCSWEAGLEYGREEETR